MFQTLPRKSDIITGGSAVMNLPAIQETWVRLLGREDPLEKVMATHSSIFATSRGPSPLP